MKTVYLVVEDWHSDLDWGNDINAFEDYKDAYEYFNDCKISNENFIDNDDKVVNSENNYFEVYEEGYYSMAHYVVRLVEKEVKSYVFR